MASEMPGTVTLGQKNAQTRKSLEIDSGTTAELQTAIRCLGRPLMSHEPRGWSQLIA